MKNLCKYMLFVFTWFVEKLDKFRKGIFLLCDWKIHVVVGLLLLLLRGISVYAQIYHRGIFCLFSVDSGFNIQPSFTICVIHHDDTASPQHYKSRAGCV